jgi:hypothetical protein
MVTKGRLHRFQPCRTWFVLPRIAMRFHASFGFTVQWFACAPHSRLCVLMRLHVCVPAGVDERLVLSCYASWTAYVHAHNLTTRLRILLTCVHGDCWRV